MPEPTSPGITRRFAEFCVGLKYEDLPEQIVAAAKNAILDLVGVALVGSTEESTRMVLKAAAGAGSSGEATVMGTGMQAPSMAAALINGYAAHALDYDDFQHKVGTHISAAVLPAALVLGETQHRSGKDLLTAYVTGFEVGCRLGRVAGFAHHLAKCGVHSTGYLGHFGAAAAAGKLAGVDAVQMNRCFGIAAGHASGVMQSLGNMCKGQNAANAARNAVLGALLAKQGFTGPENIFEGKQNIFSIYGAQTDAEELTRGLGQQFEITDNTPKIFACSGWRNPIVEASIHVATAHKLQPNDIKKVTVWASPDVTRFSNYVKPVTGLEGKFSTEHAAAVGLTDKAGGIKQFNDERVQDPGVANLRSKVTLEIDSELKPHQIRVVVNTVDGREVFHLIPAQKGDPRNPISRDELVAKFHANALAVLPQPQVEKLIAMLWDIEKVKDVAEIMRLCRAGKG